MIERIKSFIKGDVYLAGSMRRESKNPKDLDLVIKNFESIDSEIFKDLEPVRIVMREKDSGRYVELFFNRDSKTFGCFLMYFTGCTEFNNYLRGIAKKQGMVYSAYGIMKDGDYLETPNEESVFDVLGIPYFTPTERERFKTSEIIINNQTDARFIETQYKTT